MSNKVNTTLTVFRHSNRNLCKNSRNFRLYNIFEKFMVVKILTFEAEHFRNATFNNIEKLCRQIIGVIPQPFS